MWNASTISVLSFAMSGQQLQALGGRTGNLGMFTWSVRRAVAVLVGSPG
jgi:hypothetical protein